MDELTKKILQPVTNEEFNRYVKDMGIMFEEANKLSGRAIAKRTDKPKTFAENLTEILAHKKFQGQD